MNMFKVSTKLSFAVAVVMALSCGVSLAAPGPMSEKLVLCKNKKIVRTLRVEKGDDNKCRAIYTKEGVDATIGSGQYMESCAEYISNVRKNLEEAHWSCRDVKEARSSSLLLGSE